MTFKFHYENEEQKQELDRILSVEGHKHFNESDTGSLNWYTSFSENYIFFFVRDDYFLKDIQEAKESVYQQNGQNGWHVLKDHPDDLPLYEKEAILVQRKNLHEPDLCDYLSHSIGKRWHIRNTSVTLPDEEIIAWKRVESDEILLHDFLSDVEENLSFVSRVEVIE